MRDVETKRPLYVEISRFSAWRVAEDRTAEPSDETTPVLGYGWRFRYADLTSGPWRVVDFPEAAISAAAPFL
jgi:hypothetical protein